MKDSLGILGILIGIGSFAIWFSIALPTYPDVPRYAIRIFYSGYFISSCLYLFALSKNSKNKIKQLVWYSASNFYMFLMISYILNWSFDILVGLNKIIITLILTASSCILYYLFSYKSQ